MEFWSGYHHLIKTNRQLKPKFRLVFLSQPISCIITEKLVSLSRVTYQFRNKTIFVLNLDLFIGLLEKSRVSLLLK
jgi:hypothetical protein